MYYIALLAPEEINKDVLKWKKFFRDVYGCTAALKSPAHITLLPPFWMKEEQEASLANAIQQFCRRQESFPVKLSGFSCFSPKVIFVSVERNSNLELLYSSITRYLTGLNKFPLAKDTRPFHPHITLASRDLFKKGFYEAWKIFENKKYEATWTAGSISLMRHNKKNWDAVHTSWFEDQQSLFI
jgi:2'-5' RNA ligase